MSQNFGFEFSHGISIMFNVLLMVPIFGAIWAPKGGAPRISIHGSKLDSIWEPVAGVLAAPGHLLFLRPDSGNLLSGPLFEFILATFWHMLGSILCFFVFFKIHLPTQFCISASIFTAAGRPRSVRGSAAPQRNSRRDSNLATQPQRRALIINIESLI